jgi:hypothetical protein
MAEKLKYEEPTVRKIEKDQGYVFKKFEAVGFKIKEFPELYERLVELSNMPESHFDDAVKMAEMVEMLWADIEKTDNIKFSRDELKLACLFHDIGKSGPVSADRDERLIIEQIFNPVYFRASSPKFVNHERFSDKNSKDKRTLIKDMPIGEILDIENLANKEEIRKYLQTLNLHIYDEESHETRVEKLDLQRHSMIQLWREHDFWTLDLLSKYGDHKIPQDLIIVASSHHTLEGHDPAMIDGSIPNEALALETLDKYLIVTLVDKYQAFIDREGKDHPETIKILKQMAKASHDKKIINHGDKTYNLFLKYIGILEKHPEIAETVKGK